MQNIEVGEPELASARVIDFQLRALARRRAAGDYELGRWLVAGFRRGVHAELGFGSFSEYVHRLFGFSVRATEERVRTAAALEALPSLAGFAAAGALVFSVLRSLTRVVTAETEADWVGWVMGKTAREVEDEVRGRGKGDLPGDRPSSELPPKRVTLRLSPRVHALFTEVRRALDDDPEEPLSDDDLVEALASLALRPSSSMRESAHVCADTDDPSAHVCGHTEGPSKPVCADAGQASYQIALIVCEHCREGTLENGEPVDAVMVEQAACDATQLGRVDGAGVAPRATRSIPPRIRRQVVARHGGRCAVPGCRHRAFKDVHHLDLRSEGGSHDPERLVLLCTQHHQRAHEGSLVIEGLFSKGFVFRHPDGSAYGSPAIDASKAALMKQVFGALVGLEFPHAEARAMCDAAKLEISVDEDIGEAVKKALRHAKVPPPTGRTGRGIGEGENGPSVKSYSHREEGTGRSDRVAEALFSYGRLPPMSGLHDLLHRGGGRPMGSVPGARSTLGPRSRS